MRMEVVLTKDEVVEVARESVDEAEVFVAEDLGSKCLVVTTEPVVLEKKDFAASVAAFYDIPDAGMTVESMTVLPDGGVGMVFSGKKEKD